MRKILGSFLFVSLLLILITSTPVAHAQPIFNLVGLATETDPQQEIFVIIQYILTAAFPFVVAGLAFGGFLYVTSAGNEPRSERAKNIITYSIIGLVVILLAYVIIATLNTILIQ